MNDEQAKKIIRKTLKKITKNRINVIDIIVETNLPGQQIERILDGMKEEGIKPIK